MNFEGVGELGEVKPAELADEWIIAELAGTAKKVKASYEVYDIDTAARELYDFFWTKYCDWYIELSKIRIMSPDLDVKKQVLSILTYVLKSALQLLAPIMPFISEEIWQILNAGEKDSKIISESLFMEIKEGKKEVLGEMKTVQEIITKIRTLRSEMNISPATHIEAIFNVAGAVKQSVVQNNESYIKQMAKISFVQFGKNMQRPKNSALAVAGGFEIFLPLEGLIDIEKEKVRLNKEIALARQEIERTTAKLQNENFAKRAPAPEIEKIKVRLSDAKTKIETINESLKFLG
jgi:valyl-tRNA synthetase